MSGVAGAVIGLTSGAQPNIAATVALTNGGAVSRGCRTNFIGFGKGLTSEEALPQDFNATDDTVQEANSLAQSFAPTYTAVVGHADRETLSWVDTTP
jgi:hypothetical protein